MEAVLRSVLFAVAAPVALLPFCGVLALLGPLPIARRYRAGAWWARHVMLPLVRHLLGIRYRVLGQAHLPDTPCVVLAKHQSAWETIALLDILPSAAYVLKRELLWLPFLGWGLRQMPIVSIDRSAGQDALRQVIDQGQACLAKGFNVVVFPEGTRTAVGSRHRYKLGGPTLASTAAVPVLPIAHNAGEFWPRNAWIKRPGEIVVSIGPQIETAGRSPEEVCSEAEAWIEGEMRRQFPHHYQHVAPMSSRAAAH